MNQCDGCQRGLPVTDLGMHRTDSELFGCTRARYPLTLEPKTRDIWHQPAKRKSSAAPFTAGGEV
jgi:hypothetical protein